MPRKRNSENKELHARWRFKHGAYYYRVPVGLRDRWDGKTEFRLGKTLPEAHRVWAERAEATQSAEFIKDIMDRYSIEVIPKKKKATQKENNRQIPILRPVFGDMRITDIRPSDIYKYVDKRSAKVAANREMKLLSHIFSKAVEWGYMDKHPYKGEVRLQGSKPRDRYIEDWEVRECFKLGCREGGAVAMIQVYIKIKLLTALRQKDLLLLREDAISDAGIEVTISKTGKRKIYEWSPELREAVEEARALRKADISPWLFSTRRGEPYYNEEKASASAFSSAWQRFMKRLLAETDVENRFTEHDLRAKAGSDAKSLEDARKLLSHASSNITQRVYRRGVERIQTDHLNGTTSNLWDKGE